jgi:hypothetical protein
VTPTTELRFVERELPYPEVRTIRVLQQKWEDRTITLAVHITDKYGMTLPSPFHHEWRDVPLVKEEA